MAITTVNARYEGFIFDGQNSRNYGVYVTDVEVFGAPVRNVEMIQIPGRNGAYALDNGFYENIQVTYKCAMGCESQADFNAGISAFRNMLASRIGYKRLEDEINTDEYRMACFHGGISVPTLNKDTATFDVVFDCKPQRFLKSGETAVTIGGDVTNPQTKSGSIVSIESDVGDKVTSLVAQITPVQAGSGDPSPTNVRPITGWTAANVSVTGANVWDEEWSAYSSNQIRSNNTIKIKPNTQYYLAAPVVVGLYFVDASGASVGAQYKRNAVFTTPTNAVGVNLVTTDYGGNVYNNDISINYPSTDHDYHPYTGHTYPVSFGSAGTVYGGTLDVVTGVLTVTHKFLHLTSVVQVSTPSGAHVYWRFVINEKGINGATAETIICNMAKSAYGEADNTCYVTSAGSLLLLFPEDQTLNTKALVDAWLANHELQICYKLATPQTYNLTAQQVELLTGQNNVWADTGDITITWGDDPNKLVNPTLYNASPLLEFRAAAAGDISINDDVISIKPEIYGNQTLSNGGASSGREYTQTVLIDFDSTVYRAGDTITVGSITTSAQRIFSTENLAFFNGYQNSVTNGLGLIGCTYANSGARLQYGLAAPVTFTAGTSATHTATATIDIIYEKSDATTVTVPVTTTVSVAYDGDGSITVTYTISGENMRIEDSNCALSVGAITVYSTKPVLDGTVYVDLDIGEAYMDAGGAEYISANNAVTIPTKLPVLASGTNAITYDNTITQFKIVPRWWQL